MNKQQAFEQLAAEFDLKPADFYFLDLIPLIEMMWADGQNQPAEMDILYKYTIEHIAYLDHQAGAKVIGVEDANSFLERFAQNRPPERLLTELRHIAATSDTGGNNPRSRTILEHCLDIAAACTAHYPFLPQDRVMTKEKNLLRTLFQEFKIPPDTLLSNRQK